MVNKNKIFHIVLWIVTNKEPDHADRESREEESGAAVVEGHAHVATGRESLRLLLFPRSLLSSAPELPRS